MIRHRVLIILLLGVSGLALAIAPARAQVGPVDLGEVFRGAPAIDAGAVTGYIIWADAEGMHVRWTSRLTAHRFTGDVSADVPITSVRRFALERGDVVRRADYAIYWDTYVNGGIDGFDFALARSAEWVRFSLVIDGRLAAREQIFLGRGFIHPGGNPFVFRFNDAVTERWPAYLRRQPGVLVGGPAYYAWFDGRGWHVRWFTRGWVREASGLISTDGRFQEFRRAKMEEGDLTARDDGLIAWDARGYGDLDGFDFRTNGDRLTFTLLFDGMLAAPGQIVLGGGGVRPPRNPFRLTR